ncbi:MAG: hypothetical protein CVU44_14800 [Chloroflexi bacterium HGW-Chloroflexi-6]|nr:MAG: hypothetical protein CVU44_14800 [Chloroflexi bacterium HGW-Chloroflexi-6]
MEQDKMLDFVKALGHADRLRVIGVLTKAPANIKQVAEALNIPFRDAMNHLAFLEHIGAVRAQPAENKQDAIYELDTNNLENAARKQFEGQRQSYEPAPNLDEKARKVLKAYLNADGSIRQLPLQPGKLQVILDYLLQSFSPGVIYTEKEVNMILRRFNEDVSGLRRDLIDRGMMQRKSDGSQYWRPE